MSLFPLLTAIIFPNISGVAGIVIWDRSIFVLCGTHARELEIYLRGRQNSLTLEQNLENLTASAYVYLHFRKIGNN